MSLLGLDVGTSGCKATVISAEGRVLGRAYREYGLAHPRPGWSELDANEVWQKIRAVIREAAGQAQGDPVQALSVTSMGEAMTPVSRDRRILGPAIMGFDGRGGEYVAQLAERVGRERLYAINGNILGPAYSAPKLCWLRDHEPALFDRTYKFLLWGDLVYYLLGCEPVTDYSLANRTLLFDLRRGAWSEELLAAAGLPMEKLARPVAPGSVVGKVDRRLAEELLLGPDVLVVAGGHDQCCTALGAGVVRSRVAVYGIGTYICITPVYQVVPPPERMLPHSLNTEHHVVRGLYASFYYNLTGGAALKWFRDVLAPMEKAQAAAEGYDVYDRLLAEMPAGPSGLMVLPHFAPTGPPHFDEHPGGAILGLTLETSRGEFIKGLLEGVTYYFAEGVEDLALAGIAIDEFHATGGGAKSDRWLQLKADIIGKPFARMKVGECGTLGTIILAGLGNGTYRSLDEALATLVGVERVFEPDPARHAQYQERLARYRALYPLLKDYLHGLR